jgi:hypothetical protein
LTDYIRQHGTKLEFPVSDSWVVLSPIEKQIKEKIERVGKPLKEWDISINYGIKTGCNEAFIINKNKRDELIKKDAKSAELIRPILRGRDIERYKSNFADLYLINTHNGNPNKKILPIDIKNYPAVKEHLDKYWNKIKNRDDQGITPYNLRSCAYMDDFSKQKLMYPDITENLSFCLCNKEIYCNNSVYFITSNTENLEYLLKYLNSDLINWYYRTLSVQLGEVAVRMFSIYVLNIPIPKDGTENVYESYNLTKDEKNFIKSISYNL